MLPDIIVTDRIVLAGAEFSCSFTRSGGPGGQNVNKVASKAILRWSPATSPGLPEPVRVRLLLALASRLTTEGELVVTSQLTRDQGRNVADCLAKVRRLVLAAASPPKARRPTRPTFASRVRRVEAKVRRSAAKRLRRKPDAE